MRRTLLSLAALLLLGVLPSCGRPAAPDAFTLHIQMTGVNIAAIDSLRINVIPQMEGAATGMFAAPTRGMCTTGTCTYENGEITVSTDSRGILTMDVAGAYVMANAMPGMNGADPRLDIDLWSDDRMTHNPAPQVRVTVLRTSNQIAQGTVFLPAWPLPAGGEAQVNVPCLTGMTMLCSGN